MASTSRARRGRSEGEGAGRSNQSDPAVASLSYVQKGTDEQNDIKKDAKESERTAFFSAFVKGRPVFFDNSGGTGNEAAIALVEATSLS